MTEREEFLEDALKHIINTAERSRTQTKRLVWIIQRAEDALNGVKYDRQNFTLPVTNTKTPIEYERIINKVKYELKEYKEMSFLKRLKFLFKGGVK